MAKQLVLYDRSTGETKGYVYVSQDQDKRLYEGDEVVGVIEIPVGHPAQHEQPRWVVRNGKLVELEA